MKIRFYIVFAAAAAGMAAAPLPVFASAPDDRTATSSTQHYSFHSHPAGTDDSIESSAAQTYVFKTYLTGDDIKVRSKDGAVTLTGVVLEESHIDLARETVSGLPGVKNVDNRLEVRGERPAEYSDAWIRAKVRTTLLFHRNVSGGGTDVTVQNGIVTLRGEAGNRGQKELTTETVRDIVGVKDVRNEMTVAGTPKQQRTAGDKMDDASITGQVRFALMTHRSTHVLSTKVETHNGVVTLYGKAQNGSEKSLVTKLVGGINGVQSVDNRMVIASSM